LIELQKGVLQSLRNAVPQVIRETERALIDLALEAARKMVAGMPITVELIEAVVREAASQVEDTAGVTVLLNPEDLALLRKQQSPLLQGLPEAGPMRFAGSAEVSRGGCLVQTRFGILDATRETKLEQIREAICA
jgi:flagellar assembly protein FliH